MLSVEQEVEGDDTPVLDSVLSSDVKRRTLLGREKELQDAINRFRFFAFILLIYFN